MVILFVVAAAINEWGITGHNIHIYVGGAEKLSAQTNDLILEVFWNFFVFRPIAFQHSPHKLTKCH